VETDTRVPVAVLTGFLGSGKTTVLNGWLRDPGMANAAVIVNEFGEIGIDNALIASSNDNTIELSTGCLCCTVRGDLVETLRDLAEKRSRGEIRHFDRVLIETTGLADPAPVIQALMTFPVARAYRLNRVVTLVDSVQGMNTLDRHAEAVKQAAVADAIILSKTDLISHTLEALSSRLAAMNPGAVQYRTSDVVPAPVALLATDDLYDPALRPEQVRDWLAVETDDGHHHHAHEHARHDAEIGSFGLTFDEPLHWEHVATWLDALVSAHGPDLLRVKGILDIAGRDRPIVVQAVQRLFSPPAELNAWPDGLRRSRIVFIARNLGRDYVAEVLRIIRTRRPAA
jgi:G3E family GTPase